MLCTGGSTATIVGHAGGFADKVRAGWQWIIPLPEELDPESAGPLLCGGITVFDPILKHQIQAIHHVGVIGIGGLGHMAIKLLRGWGCEITAFTSNLDKTEELKAMGADHVVNSRDVDALKTQRGKFDLLLSTVNVTLNWPAYISTLAPNGTIHLLGLPLEPIKLNAGSSELVEQSLSRVHPLAPLRHYVSYSNSLHVKTLRHKLNCILCHS